MNDFSNHSTEYALSYGEWKTEVESVEFLKDLLKSTSLFNPAYCEVEGRIVQPRPFTELKTMRIDMIVTPTAKLLNAGWKGGPIGIECKKSGIKINEPYAQVDDYTRTIWMTPNGYMFMCQYYFLWPYHKSHGFVASQMAQNRIGTIEHKVGSWGSFLKFYCGESKVICYDFHQDQVSLGKCDFGFKAGSR